MVEDLLLQSGEDQPFRMLDPNIPLTRYCPIHLSWDNPQLQGMDITDPEACQGYIDSVLATHNARVAYGGYLEKRKLYTKAGRFAGNSPRDIHLGVDFWCIAGTEVLAPLEGRVHSFANNSDPGNYGPTIVLQHQLGELKFYTLYGHLSLESLQGLYPGKEFRKREVLATLGTTKINVGYAPHLHFQLILDMGRYQGDYPGVCSEKDLPFYKKNCPDPNLLLGMK